ncbi:hypothetical protein [Methylobacterium nodulans]|uniref:hypothetical protein n=1 Tax=Methylobacterium nodulans TaxID=114616 RepID=UPI0001616684|nr:hypothetical protein [Methylobacterium nodulans]
MAPAPVPWQGPVDPAPIPKRPDESVARVIESVMIFALGVLSAGLCALVVLPSLNARAERLARRRLEAQFPMSIAELTAEKDHLRAEFAVLQRQLERKVEEARAERREEMEEFGRRAVRIGTLATELEQRDARLAVLERDLAGTRARLASVEAERDELRVARAAAEEALRALEGPHQRALADLEATRTALEEARRALTEAETACGLAEEQAREARENLVSVSESVAAGAHAQIQALEDALADLTARHVAVEQELAELRPAHAATLEGLAGARRALAEAEARHPPSERLQAENAALERRIVEVAEALMAQARPAGSRPEPRLPPATPLPSPAAARSTG